ncbi:hypothetical protein [Paeniglutamicibacter cryotolerans]|uniref:Uncharacterized protein n=1 Tax=Paeniglutamicibacter cryotolerans TaxID=670079 RepID=A0A839QUM3_9MICC|nr:hypothetical protein [Paeniglutamicibacter cryotolerans]MBB2996982.1 hypothetical protein [Paeniglutamicibacter cryotolerans]
MDFHKLQRIALRDEVLFIVLAFVRYLNSLHPLTERIAILLDHDDQHRAMEVAARVGDWAAANHVELA